MGGSHPVEHPLVVHQLAGTDATGEHDDVGVGELLERRVDGHAQQTVLAADLAAFMADEGDVDGGDALQHLVRADRVECGEAGEEGNGDLHGCGPF